MYVYSSHSNLKLHHIINAKTKKRNYDVM